MEKTKTKEEKPKGRERDLLWQKRVYRKDDTRSFKKLCGILASLASGSSKTTSSKNTQTAKQNCVVKARRGKNMKEHERFLNEYLPQKNKETVSEKPELFNADGQGDAAIEAYKKTMCDAHFKFIISPEHQGVDCRALVKTLVKRMEAVTGYQFSYLAAVHTDTAHTHAHLLVNGVDKNGRAITLDNTLLTQTIREMTRDICTTLAGGRSRKEIAASLSGMYKRFRYTTLDDRIAALETPHKDESGGSSVIVFEEMLRKRLDVLAGMGLAEPDGAKWKLAKNWKESLKAAGRYNSFLKARNEARFTAANDIELYTKKTGAVSGVVTKIYRMNYENSWNHAVLIENKHAGKAWYVPLYHEPNKNLSGCEIQVSTNAPPAQLCIKSVNKDGNIITLNNSLYAIPGAARALCADLTGGGSREEIAALRAVRYKRALDNSIAARKTPLKDESGFESAVTVSEENMRKRLAALAGMGLAQADGAAWKLVKGWKECLKAAEPYSAFLTARIEAQFTTASNVELYTEETGAVSGMITKVYQNDYEQGTYNAVLIENKHEGKAWYVPLLSAPGTELLECQTRVSAAEPSAGLLTPDITVLKGNDTDRSKQTQR